MKHFRHEQSFPLESGTVLQGITVAYHTYGKLNAGKTNVVWICHHLTANSDVSLWWKDVAGWGNLIDPDRHFIVCANILGSCYGSSGPLTIDPAKDAPYYSNFPLITIRDMVKAHMLLKEHLGISSINLLIGGSMGGYQALEWCVLDKAITSNLVLMSTSASESAWGIAVHTAQRLAIEADSTWRDNSPMAGSKGLKAARAVGLISYRNHGILVNKQTDPEIEKTDNYKASAYINYQGDKLVSRFNAQSYWLLTKAMDSHNLARGRNSTLEEVLRGINQRTLVFGILSDILCPLPEQQFLAANMPNATLITIDSAYGHDGFMVEAEIINRYIKQWWENGN